MPSGKPCIMGFMREVVKLKLEQNPALKQLAIDCAREGILPIEVSQYDDNWASGPTGKGANMLGNGSYRALCAVSSTMSPFNMTFYALIKHLWIPRTSRGTTEIFSPVSLCN